MSSNILSCSLPSAFFFNLCFFEIISSGPGRKNGSFSFPPEIFTILKLQSSLLNSQRPRSIFGKFRYPPQISLGSAGFREYCSLLIAAEPCDFCKSFIQSGCRCVQRAVRTLRHRQAESSELDRTILLPTPSPSRHLGGGPLWARNRHAFVGRMLPVGLIVFSVFILRHPLFSAAGQAMH